MSTYNSGSRMSLRSRILYTDSSRKLVPRCEVARFVLLSVHGRSLTSGHLWLRSGEHGHLIQCGYFVSGHAARRTAVYKTRLLSDFHSLVIWPVNFGIGHQFLIYTRIHTLDRIALAHLFLNRLHIWPGGVSDIAPSVSFWITSWVISSLLLR